MVEYHSSDFEFEEWAAEVSSSKNLPEVTDIDSISRPAAVESKNDWDYFFEQHNGGSFFKPRRYIEKEFQTYLCEANTVLEVGCGYGCSMFPLLEKFSFKYIATDYSREALVILRNHPNFDPIRISTELWDVSQPLQLTIEQPDAILCIFALSAVAPSQHIECLLNMKNQLKNRDSVILFRDYGVHDMTMYRHTIRHDELLFRRTDGTLAYYFDLAYIQSISAAVGLYCIEAEYATVCVRNRKSSDVMHRVFVHAVLRPIQNTDV
jgi:methyltransferase-like protein 6